MCNVINLLRHLGRYYYHTILITYNGISWTYDDTRNGDDSIAFPWLHGSGALSCGGGVGEAGETVVDDFVCVADGTVGDESSDVE
eukprot:13804129-Ditylum_brightwellii.AAC.1